MTDLRMERFKYTLAVVLYGTIGVFVRYVMLPSELIAMCRGMDRSGAGDRCGDDK